MMGEAFSYQGTELDLFAQAVNWKRYFGKHLSPHISGRVLEVGAGIGGTTRLLLDGSQESWTCLEPDASMAEHLQGTFSHAREGMPTVTVRSGTVGDLRPEDEFDTILYVDVLEHIEDDAGELAAAGKHLRSGGKIVVLSPAHEFLFSPFDKAVGHYRRYSRKSLCSAAPPSLALQRAIYLDSVGLLMSLANRALLKSKMPSASQIRFWDRVIVPLSRLLDPLVGHGIGKSVVAVWRQAEERTSL